MYQNFSQELYVFVFKVFFQLCMDTVGELLKDKVNFINRDGNIFIDYLTLSI